MRRSSYIDTIIESLVVELEMTTEKLHSYKTSISAPIPVFSFSNLARMYLE